jgi:hypothetical protein
MKPIIPKGMTNIIAEQSTRYLLAGKISIKTTLPFACITPGVLFGNSLEQMYRFVITCYDPACVNATKAGGAI